MSEFTERNSVHIEDLPNELWINFLTYLPISDILQMRLVSKRWRDLASLPEFMRMSKLTINEQNLNEIRQRVGDCREYIKFENVEINGLDCSEKLHEVLSVIGKDVLHLRLKRAPVFENLCGNLPNLEQLAISAIGDMPQLKNLLAMNLNQFKKLNAIECDCFSLRKQIKLSLLQQLTQDETILTMRKLQLEYTHDNEDLLLHVLETHAPTLDCIDIFFSSTPRLSQHDWNNVFRQFHQLVTIKLAGNCNVEWLATMINCIPAEAPVRHVDLTGMLTLLGVLLQTIALKWPKSLISLELMFCVQLDDDSVASLGTLRDNLKVLSVAYSRELSNRSLLEGLASKPNFVLQELHLEDLNLLDEECICLLAERLPNLRKLSLDNCRNAVTNKSLACIFQHQTLLQELVLDECTRLTDEGLLGYGETPYPIKRLRGLQSLSMRGCRNLSNSVLMGALQFTELRRLTLGYCHKFSAKGFAELVKHSPSIDNLSVTSCSMIEDKAVLIIADGFHRLRRLNISNCFNITGLSIEYIDTYCKALEELTVCGVTSLDKKDVKNRLEKMKTKMKEVIW